jgi:hypothetical protein
MKSIFMGMVHRLIVIALSKIFLLLLSIPARRLKALWELCTQPVIAPSVICLSRIAGSGGPSAKTHATELLRKT